MKLYAKLRTAGIVALIGIPAMTFAQESNATDSPRQPPIQEESTSGGPVTNGFCRSGSQFVGGGYATLFFSNTDCGPYEVHWTATYTINGIPNYLYPMNIVNDYAYAYLDWGSQDSNGNTKYVYGDYFFAMY